MNSGLYCPNCDHEVTKAPGGVECKSCVMAWEGSWPWLYRTLPTRPVGEAARTESWNCVWSDRP